ADAVRIEPQHLVDEIVRVREIARVLVDGRPELELLDPQLAVTVLDQHFAKGLICFRIILVVGYTRLELLDAGRRRRLLDVGEDERAGLVGAAADLVDPEIDEPRPPPAGGDRGLVLGLDKAGMTWWFVERQRLIVDVVSRVRGACLEVRLELERGHFHDGLPRPGTRGGGPFRHHRFYARGLGCRGSGLLEHWGLRGLRRRLGSGRRLRGLGNVPLEHQIRAFKLYPLIRVHRGRGGLQLGNGLELKIGWIQFFTNRRGLGTGGAHLAEIRSRGLETLQHAAGFPSAHPGRFVNETGRLDFQRLIGLGLDVLNQPLIGGSGRGGQGRRRQWWSGRRGGGGRLSPFWLARLIEIEKDKTGRLALPRFADVLATVGTRRGFGRGRRGGSGTAPCRQSAPTGIGAIHLQV